MQKRFMGYFVELTLVVYAKKKNIFLFETSQLGEKLELLIYSKEKIELQRIIRSYE